MTEFVEKIYCPRCQLEGRIRILGEILPGGTVAIHRQHTKFGYGEATLISGKDFAITCGLCRTTIPMYGQDSFGTLLYMQTQVTRVTFKNSNGSVH